MEWSKKANYPSSSGQKAAFGHIEDMKPLFPCQDNNARTEKKKLWSSSTPILSMETRKGRDDGDPQTGPLQACRASGRLGIPAPMRDGGMSATYFTINRRLDMSSVRGTIRHCHSTPSLVRKASLFRTYFVYSKMDTRFANATPITGRFRVPCRPSPDGRGQRCRRRCASRYYASWRSLALGRKHW